jgi:hypothetical protein
MLGDQLVRAMMLISRSEMEPVFSNADEKEKPVMTRPRTLPQVTPRENDISEKPRLFAGADLKTRRSPLKQTILTITRRTMRIATASQKDMLESPPK